MMKLKTIQRSLIVVGFAISSIGIWLFLIYSIPGQNFYTAFPARWMNLPFARIDDERIGLGRMYRDYVQLRYVRDGSADISDQELLSSIWKYIRNEAALYTIASLKGVTWTSNDIDKAEKYFLDENGLSYSDLLRSMPLFNHEHFRQHTIIPIVLRSKIQQKLLLEEVNPALEEMRQLWDQLMTDPSLFSAIKKERTQSMNVEYTDDTILIPNSEISSEEQEMFASVTSGGITPIIVRRDGYRIYQVINHFVEPENVWQLRELFIPGPSIDTVIDAAVQNQNIRYYIQGVLADI